MPWKPWSSRVTRTSTERGAARGDRRFRRALTATTVVLALLCGGLAVLAAGQGPKVSAVQVDVQAVVERPGQQLRLFANQVLAQVAESEVVIDPPARFAVEVSGDVVAITFLEALRYDTEYAVRIEAVTSPYVATESTLTTAFTTPGAEVWQLQRADPAGTVFRGDVLGRMQSVVTAPRIQSFALLKDAVVYTQLGADLRSAITIASVDGAFSEQIPLPADTTLRGFAVDPGGTVLGFQATSLDDGPFAADTLVLVDLEAGRTPVPVTGLDGTPLHVLAWQFEPAGGILALASDGLVTRIGADGVPLPLGRFDELGTLSPDGSRVFVGRTGEGAVLDLSDGTSTPFEPSGLGDRVPVLSAARFLPDGDVLVPAVQADAGILTYSLLRLSADGAFEQSLFELVGGAIAQFTVSPNGQFAALAIIPDVRNSRSDLYGAEAMSTSVETVMVDVESGEEVGRLPGFATRW